MDQKEESLKALFCVPDLTGFTQLIATADISFSKEIIPTLLRKLIDANILNLNIAEIEGDAIFFYRTGRLPAAKLIVKQCHVFYKAFADYILQIKKTHPEYYQKHLSDGELGLKIIIHYGDVSTANIKGRTKLLGQDVIIAHKLLKNKIKDSEYILFTENYLKKIRSTNAEALFSWAKFKEGSESYDFIGEVKYKYIKLYSHPTV